LVKAIYLSGFPKPIGVIFLASLGRGPSKFKPAGKKSDVTTKSKKLPAHCSHRILDSKATVFKALKFLGWFAVLSLTAYLLLGSSHQLKEIAAGSSALLLDVSGKQATVDYAFSDPVIYLDGVSARIADYCSAGIEVAVLFGIVFASEDRTFKRRLAGFAAGTLLILVFNAIRIFLVLYFFSSSSPTISSILHDVLFRASIVVFLATFYAVWYYWDGPQD
jgi:exosortase/archaeosortase family protein